MKLIFKGTKDEYHKVLDAVEKDICPSESGLELSRDYCGTGGCAQCWMRALGLTFEEDTNMKELVTEATVRLTYVERGTEGEIDEIIRKDRAEGTFAGFIERCKEWYDFDTVAVVDIKHFVNDIREDEPEQQVDGIDYDKLAVKVIEKLMDRNGIKTEVFFEDNMED